MDFRESQEIIQMREALRRFLDKEAPLDHVAEWDRNDEIPRTMLDKLSTLGVCGLVVPEEYGGVGRNVLGYVTTIEELARRSFCLASLYAMNAGYGGLNISSSGNAEQKARFLPDISKGKLVFAYGLSEPDVGGDLASVKTRAEIRNGKVIVNGAKRWTSGALDSDYIHCLARTGPVDARHKNLSFIIVPSRAPGVTIRKIEVMGSGGNAPTDVTFDNVEVPVENILGGLSALNTGWTQLIGPALEIEKLQPAALALGIAEAAVDEAWTYSQNREQFGTRICTIQSIRHALADAQTTLHACRLVLQQAAWLVQEQLPSAVQTSMAKLFVCDATTSVVLSCQRVMGAYGYAKGFQMERLVRDSLLYPIIGGSSDIQRNNIANLLKLPRK